MPHPVYYLSLVAFERLVDEIEQVLRRVRPEMVVSFGEDGLTGHDDHVTAGAAADAAFHHARKDASDGAFQAEFHVAVPTSAVGRFDDQLRELGVSTGTPVASRPNLGGRRSD